MKPWKVFKIDDYRDRPEYEILKKYQDRYVGGWVDTEEAQDMLNLRAAGMPIDKIAQALHRGNRAVRFVLDYPDYAVDRELVMREYEYYRRRGGPIPRALTAYFMGWTSDQMIDYYVRPRAHGETP